MDRKCARTVSADASGSAQRAFLHFQSKSALEGWTRDFAAETSETKSRVAHEQPYLTRRS